MNDKLNFSLAKNFSTNLITGEPKDPIVPEDSNFYFTQASTAASSTMTPYQSVKFIEDYLAKNVSFLQKITKMPVKAQTGKLPILNVTEKNWRTAGTDGTTVAYVEGSYKQHSEGKIRGVFSEIPYTLTKLMADMTITHDFLRFNIEREGAENTILNLVARRHAEDIADFMLCGGMPDNKTLSKTKDTTAAFYKMTNGFIIKLYNALIALGLGKAKPEDKVENEQILDRTDDEGFTDDVFYDLVKSINESDISIGNYVWLCHPSMKILLMEYLKHRQTLAGDMAIIGKIGEMTPLDIPFETVFCFPKDMIILCDPKDFTLAYYDEISFRKTDEGATLVQTDSRYYVWYYWLDFLVTAPKKMAMAININLNIVDATGMDPNSNLSDNKTVQTPAATKSKNLPILST